MMFWHWLIEAVVAFLVAGFLVYLESPALLKRKIGLGAFAVAALIAFGIERIFRLLG
jgi:hypothetical protein